jgi:hypothetical protein
MQQYVVLRDSKIFDDHTTLQEAIEKASYKESKLHTPMVICEVVKISQPIIKNIKSMSGVWDD